MSIQTNKQTNKNLYGTAKVTVTLFPPLFFPFVHIQTSTDRAELFLVFVEPRIHQFIFSLSGCQPSMGLMPVLGPGNPQGEAEGGDATEGGVLGNSGTGESGKWGIDIFEFGSWNLNILRFRERETGGGVPGPRYGQLILSIQLKTIIHHGHRY